MTTYSPDDLQEISVWIKMAITPYDSQEAENNLKDLLTMFPFPILNIASKRLSSLEQKNFVKLSENLKPATT